MGHDQLVMTQRIKTGLIISSRSLSLNKIEVLPDTIFANLTELQYLCVPSVILKPINYTIILEIRDSQNLAKLGLGVQLI